MILTPLLHYNGITFYGYVVIGSTSSAKAAQCSSVFSATYASAADQ